MDPFGEEAALAAVVKETRGDTKKKSTSLQKQNGGVALCRQ